MPDAASRTDLFKALNNFMAVLAAYAPGSHREDVVLEVGDTAFRAFERALVEPTLPATCPAGGFDIQVHTQSGRVVIRKRQPPRDERTCCDWDTDGDGGCPRHPKTGPFARAQREAQLEREKASAHENVPAPPGTMPKAAPCPHGNVGCGVARVCEVCKRETKAPAQPKPDGPSISPCQALGEALACVERAKHLLESVCTAPSGVHVDVRLAVFRAYTGAETAWTNAVSARALLAQQEKPK